MADISNATGGQPAKPLRSKRTTAENRIIRAALHILKEELAPYGPPLNNPSAAREYLQLKLGALEHEVFIAIWLDSQNGVIGVEEMFRGTLTQTSVFPREVLKSALRHNAAAVIFGHNHPSGTPQPSEPDKSLTDALEQALSLVDIRVNDHFIVGRGLSVSFAELGLLRTAKPVFRKLGATDATGHKANITPPISKLERQLQSHLDRLVQSGGTTLKV